MKLLLISNSTNAGEAYLEHPKQQIKDFYGQLHIKKVLFIPYAGVTMTFDEYAAKVQVPFREIGLEVDPIHQYDDPVDAVKKAEAIAVGGGNTWQLIDMMQKNNLLAPIRQRVLDGMPYSGWSAGSNVACPTIKTTNDMAIVEPQHFGALNLVKFQINPHYLDANPDGHAGETRETRILEYIEVNPDAFVVGLREGTMFHIDGNNIKLIGPRNARIFKKGTAPYELTPSDDFSFLL